MIFKPFPDNDITREERLYIAEIQEKLRALELQSDGVSSVPVDGVFGPMTTASVQRFQQKNGLASTGIVDRDTYRKLVEAYDAMLLKNILSVSIIGFLPPDGVAFREGDEGDGVRFLNIMLQKIASVFRNVPPSSSENVYTDQTVTAVAAVQKIVNLPPTGIVNRQSWNRIAELYNDLVRSPSFSRK